MYGEGWVEITDYSGKIGVDKIGQLNAYIADGRPFILSVSPETILPENMAQTIEARGGIVVVRQSPGIYTDYTTLHPSAGDAGDDPGGDAGGDPGAEGGGDAGGP